MPLNDPNWPDIEPGQFRHQFTLLEQTIDVDISGSIEKYAPGTPPVKAWAKKEIIRIIRSTDLIKGGMDVSKVYLKLTLWYRREFAAPKQRIQDGAGKQFIIQAAENVLGMNTVLVLTCEGIGDNN